MLHDANSFGSKYGNGSWNGMMALVSSGAADIVIGDFVMTKERSEVVSFTVALEFGGQEKLVNLSVHIRYELTLFSVKS